MRRVISAVLVIVLMMWASPSKAAPGGQDGTLPQAAAASVVAPAFVRLDGVFKTAAGDARTGTVTVVISLYASQTDATPLWSEEQTIALDAAGRYTVFAGASRADGLPKELFGANAAQWLGVAVKGDAEQPRVGLVSVPYALKAQEAETLAGRSVTDFLLSPNAGGAARAATGSALVPALPGEGGTNAITVDALVKYTTGGGATDSSVAFDVGGNIGIGTATPSSKLQVVGTVGATTIDATTVRANTALLFSNGRVGFREITGNILTFDGGSAYPQGYRFPTLGVQAGAMGITDAGNVGIGTLSPTSKLEVNGTVAATLIDATNVRANSTLLFSNGRFGFREITGNILTFDGGSAYPQGYRFPTLGVQAGALAITDAGNVGIGTLAPSTKLHVVGDVTVTGNIGAKYQDVAEWVETVEPLEVGTVVIVDPLASDHVMPSARAYDTRVAGAVSRQPGLVLGEPGDSKSLIAQSGRVRIKVDATYGAIKPGDLLVTSPTVGHAMLSKPMKIGGQLLHRPGTLVGKALEALSAGKGEILVLLTLQ